MSRFDYSTPGPDDGLMGGTVHSAAGASYVPATGHRPEDFWATPLPRSHATPAPASSQPGEAVWAGRIGRAIGVLQAAIATVGVFAIVSAPPVDAGLRLVGTRQQDVPTTSSPNGPVLHETVPVFGHVPQPDTQTAFYLLLAVAVSGIIWAWVGHSVIHGSASAASVLLWLAVLDIAASVALVVTGQLSPGQGVVSSVLRICIIVLLTTGDSRAWTHASR